MDSPLGAQPPENPRLVAVGLGCRSSRASGSEEDGLGPGQQFHAILHRAGRPPGLKSTGQARVCAWPGSDAAGPSSRHERGRTSQERGVSRVEQGTDAASLVPSS